jgi:exosortase
VRDVAASDKTDLERVFEFPPAVKAALLLAVVVFVYYASFAAMVQTWRSSEAYSHGFLIPVISGFLVWRKRKDIGSAPRETDPRGFLLLLGGIVLLLAGSLAFEAFTIRVSFLVVISGLIYLLLGKYILRELLFPLGYLFLMIPLPHIVMKSIAVGMKFTYAKITYRVISSTGVPIVRDGVRLDLPNVSLVVADYCTGVLSIIAIVALSVVYAYLTQRTLFGKVTLVILAVPIALLGNMLRLVSTVWLTYYFGRGVLDSAIHQFHGVFNFLITIAFLVLLGKFVNMLEGKLVKGMS